MNESILAIVAMIENGEYEAALAALKFIRSRMIGMATQLDALALPVPAHTMRDLAGGWEGEP